MGNYVSCIPKKMAGADFVDSEGNVRRISTPAKAAELMLEAPGHVVCQADELRLTCRVLPLKADDELLRGHAYLLFPVARIHSRVSEAEMARVEATFEKKKKKKKTKKPKKMMMMTTGACKRVFPETEKERGVVGVCSEGEGEENWEMGTGFPCYRLCNYRQWTPVLETINEGT